MSFFGMGKKLPKPADLVKNAKDAISLVEKGGEKNVQKGEEELKKSLAGMKITLCGDTEHDVVPENTTALANEAQTADIIPGVIGIMEKLDFETKKDFVTVFNNLLRRQNGTSGHPAVEYLAKKPNVLEILVNGYTNQDIALNCGAMLRECARHEALTKIVLWSPTFWKFFSYVEMANFDGASDSFSTFKELLVKHKVIVADFLEKNYDTFFEQYQNLLNSNNYGAKRQSLRLLGELLLDRANFNVMTRYISEPANLKLMMMMLRDKNKSIQFEAFHVFKVFVANPKKLPSVLSILTKNKEKLISFLNNFHNDKEDDQFNDEKAFLIKQVQQLPSP
ncbi:hypothetical protein PROFUN_13403 [Planoprotostelium fungivorum]|uniref:Calcium-binding protein 39 n=1 Tax=Planoprotostelium fungivorum TaxID=1890364 RepID=A0A2P6N3N7_9EUKA|nr:hypothetical protein PROFUN_13403 [Planoprotostelium fungivorum]